MQIFTLKKTLILGVVIPLLAILLALIIWRVESGSFGRPPIKVGVLHALTGTMAISEKSVAEATLMAIEEINEKGGILGRRIEPIVVDTRSDGEYSAQMAEKLITEEKVSVIFGCWTSACRKTVKRVVEEHNHLLIYPVQYEGLEDSPNIIYNGAAPNQQIIPAIKWAFDHIGNRFFLVGSDYIYPRTANAIADDQIKALGGEVVGEEYLLLGSHDVKPIIKKIMDSKPTVIINTINGDSNITFFNELRAQKITPDKIPTISFSIAEEELRHLNPAEMAGDYAVWNYFESIPTKENREFVSDFKKRYGKNRVTDDPLEAGYFGVFLWAQAVADSGTDDVSTVRENLKSQSFSAPEGTVVIDSKNLNTWKIVRVGKIKSDGQFDIVWSSIYPVQPVPYPIYRTKAEWERFIHALYKKWGNRWVNPGTTTSHAKEHDTTKKIP